MSGDRPNVRPFRGTHPTIAATAFIDPSAQVIGDVVVGEESSIWMNTIVRGDVHWIRIGARTNIQDLCMVHVTNGKHATTIGDDVTVGHHVTLHGCTVGNRVLVGIGATVMDGAVLEDDVLLAAGSLVTPGKCIPSGVLARGSPAAPARDLTDEEKAFLKQSALNYVGYAKEYRGL